MLDSSVSSRRHAAEADAVSASPTPGLSSGDDESKTKRHHISLLASKYFFRFTHASPCLIICVLVLFGAVSLIFHYSHNLVCFSPYDPLSRFGPGLYRPDSLESGFGYLGVSWCRSKHGKRVEWTTEDLIKGLEEFVPVYETRPVKNMYGMGFDHSFGLWFIARWVKLDLMIESGAFKGHSTWVLRQAMPDKSIISLSPRHPAKYLKKGPAYVDENCTDFAGKDFVD